MDQQSPSAPPAFRTLAGEFLPLLIGLLFALDVGIATWLLARRLTGALIPGGAAGALVGCAALFAALALLTRLAFLARARGGNWALQAAVGYGPAFALIVATGALTSARAPWWALAAAWGIVLLEELAALAILNAQRIGWRMSGPPSPRQSARSWQQTPARRVTPDAGRGVPAADRSWQTVPADVVQRIERTLSEQGQERITASLAVALAPGQLTAHLHVAFCPPLRCTPRIEYRQTAGPPARIKLGQALPHGARFDIKLAESSASSTRVVLLLRAHEDTSALPGQDVPTTD